MKKFLILLTALVCLQACKDETTNWTPDLLEATVSGTIPVAEGKIFGAGDGNWGINVKSAYKGVVQVDIVSSGSWDLIIKYITIESEGWITPSLIEGSGDSSLTLTIADNKSILYRKASVMIRSRGEISVDKTITIIQTDSDPIIELDPVAGGTVEFDEDTGTLSVGYGASEETVSFWSNIANCRARIVPQSVGDDISWVKGFKLSTEDGTITFSTSNNFIGTERAAIIRIDADGFEGMEYILHQKASLYKNVLKTVDGNEYDELAPMANYGIKGRTIALNFDTDQPLQVEIIDKTTSQPAVGWASAAIAGNIVSLTLQTNVGVDDNQGAVRVKSSDGSMSAQPAVEWSFKQLREMLNATSSHKVGEGLVVFGPLARVASSVVVGRYETTDDDVQIACDQSWASFTLQGGQIKLTSLDGYSGAELREANITLTNLNGAMTKSLTLKQYGNKEINEKTNWSAEFANSHTGATATRRPELMFDGKWRMDASGQDSFWESYQGTPDYEFIFDLGTVQQFNSFGMMPRQQWPMPAPKEFKVAVSDDKVTWVNMGTFAGFELSELSELYKKQVKWGQFPTVNSRYMKVSFGVTHRDNLCCIEEIFIELQ